MLNKQEKTLQISDNESYFSIFWKSCKPTFISMHEILAMFAKTLSSLFFSPPTSPLKSQIIGYFITERLQNKVVAYIS